MRIFNKDTIEEDYKPNFHYQISNQLNKKDPINIESNYRAFIPYSLKDFKDKNYNQSLKLPRSLGSNVGSEIWNEKFDKRKNLINFSESYKVIPSKKPKFTPMEEKDQINLNKLKMSKISISKEFCSNLPSLKERKTNKYNHYNYSKIVDNKVYEEEIHKYENIKLNKRKEKILNQKMNSTNNNFDKNWRETQHNLYFKNLSNNLKMKDFNDGEDKIDNNNEEYGDNYSNYDNNVDDYNNDNNFNNKNNHDDPYLRNNIVNTVNTEDSNKSKFVDDLNSKKTKNSHFTFNAY